jgi:hypothetical protein
MSKLDPSDVRKFTAAALSGLLSGRDTVTYQKAEELVQTAIHVATLAAGYLQKKCPYPEVTVEEPEQ